MEPEHAEHGKAEKTPRRRSRLRRWAVNLALVCGGVVVALVLVEVILRIIYPFPQPQFLEIDEFVGHRHRPGISGYYVEEGFAKYTINSHGFRDREYAIDKPPGVFRIAVLGDSFAEAIQVDLDATFHEIVEDRLKDVEVLNFGVSGYGTAQELLCYRHFAREFAPDLVILLFCSANDLTDNSRVLSGGYPRPYFHLREGNLELDTRFRQSRRHRFLHRWGGLYYSLTDHSALLQALDRWRRTRGKRQRAKEARQEREAAPEPAEPGLARSIYGPPAGDDLKDAWELTERLLLELNEDVRADGAVLMIVTTTLSIQVDEQLRAQTLRAHPDWDLDYPDRRVRRFATEHDIPCLVLAPALLEHNRRTGRRVHGFGEKPKGHWNREGHRVVAERLSDFLIERRLVPSDHQ